MDDDFSWRIKKIEQELLALKTSSLFTSIRNSVSTVFRGAQTGLYRVVYNNRRGESIISSVYSSKYKNTLGGIYARTPQGLSQIIEVDTTYIPAGSGSASPVTYTIDFVVVSNVPVVSITRLS